MYLKGDLENSAVILDSLWLEEKGNEKVRRFFRGVLNELADKYYVLRNYESMKVIVEKLKEVSPEDAIKWKKKLEEISPKKEKKKVLEKKKRVEKRKEEEKRKVYRKERKTEKKKERKKVIRKETKKESKKEIKREPKEKRKKIVKKDLREKKKEIEEKEEVSVKKRIEYKEPEYKKHEIRGYLIYYILGMVIVVVFFTTYIMFLSHQKKIDIEKEKIKSEFEKKQREREERLRRELERLKMVLEEERKKELEKRRRELEEKRVEIEKKRQQEFENKIKELEERIKREKKIEEILKREEKKEMPEPASKETDDIWKIKRVDIPMDYTELEKMLKSDLKSMRIHALWALGEKGGRISYQILSDFLKDDISFEEKREALKALKKMLLFEDTPQDIKLKIEEILKEERRKGWIV